MNPNMNLPTEPPSTGTQITNTCPRTLSHESPPHRDTPPQMSSIPEKLQRKLYTRPHSKHLHRILPPTTECIVTARHGPRATPPQPLTTDAKEQTPPSTVLTTEPPTLHQGG
ncbi:hypothetical protein CHARACLAT_028137 [Characodon lateralis]|uniref:Uncharacterized protein n=1 Tax=Characodon lateralis TaxID=208331 RepID=A0ABU7EMX7_9TELE|nr:hypothetical protein [Characodon lateralis]